MNVKVYICKTLTQHYRNIFFEGKDPKEKQNWDGLVASCVCTTVALNRIISSEGLGHYKWY